MTVKCLGGEKSNIHCDTVALTCVPGGCSDGVRGAGAGARGDGSGRVAGLSNSTRLVHISVNAPAEYVTVTCCFLTHLRSASGVEGRRSSVTGGVRTGGTSRQVTPEA